MRIVLERLEALRITTDTHHENPPNLAYSQNLKILTIPGKLHSWSHPRLGDVIPQRLEAIEIPCDRKTFPWEFLVQLQHAVVDGTYPSLRSIRLFVDEPYRSFAYHVAPRYTDAAFVPYQPAPRGVQSWRMYLLQSTGSNPAIHEALANWARTNIAFETFFKGLSSKGSQLDLEDFSPVISCGRYEPCVRKFGVMVCGPFL